MPAVEQPDVVADVEAMRLVGPGKDCEVREEPVMAEVRVPRWFGLALAVAVPFP